MRHTRRPRSPERSDPIRIEVVAKPGGGSRTLAHLDGRDRRRYELAVAGVAAYVERSLSSGSMANRARTASGFQLEAWGAARRPLPSVDRHGLDGSHRAAFVGDVRDCYGSITPSIVELALRGAGAPDHAAARVAGLLRSFHERGVRGLPIGPAPSALLANGVLANDDRALAEAAGGPSFRWVDDVVVFAPHARAAERVAAELRPSARGARPVGAPRENARSSSTVQPCSGGLRRLPRRAGRGVA